MGYRTTQRILECSICGRIPNDGEYLWEMCGKYECVDCVDKDNTPEDAPEIFLGTMDALDKLTITK
jgi:hypothetical protein